MPGSARDRACATAAWLVGCAPCMPSLLSGGAPVITDTFMRHRRKCVRDHGTGFWVGGGAAASAAAAAGAVGVGSWTSHSTPSGGTVSTADAGRPCQGSPVASTCPMLPTPLPPYSAASLLIISRHTPVDGSPTR